MKKLILCVLVLMLFATPAMAAFPEKSIQGHIMWGAGGSTDSVSRITASLAQEYLGQSIIMQNRTGAAGAVATTYVYNQKPDGYNILFGAENPTVYKVTGITEIDYEQFEPIMLFMDAGGVVVVSKDSPYNDYKSLIEAIKGGKKIKFGSTGTGGLSLVANAMVEKIHGIKLGTTVEFDGEAGAITALMGGHIDAIIVGLLSASSFIQSGAIKGLTMIAYDRVPSIKDIPSVVEIYPEYKSYLPCGTFFGAFVKKGTPKATLDKLQDAFKKAYNDPKFDEFANKIGGMKLGYTGDKAKEYIAKSRSVRSWLLYESGGAKFSPEKFGIPSPIASK